MVSRPSLSVAVFAIGQFLSLVAGLGLQVIVARSLLPADYGSFVIANTVLLALTLGLVSAIPKALGRIVSVDHRQLRPACRTILGLQFPICCGVALLLWTVVGWDAGLLKDTRLQLALQFIVIELVLRAGLLEPAWNLLNGLRCHGTQAALMLLHSLFRLTCVGLFLSGGIDLNDGAELTGCIVALAAASVMSLLVVVPVLARVRRAANPGSPGRGDGARRNGICFRPVRGLVSWVAGVRWLTPTATCFRHFVANRGQESAMRRNVAPSRNTDPACNTAAPSPRPSPLERGEGVGERIANLSPLKKGEGGRVDWQLATWLRWAPLAEILNYLVVASNLWFLKWACDDSVAVGLYAACFMLAQATMPFGIAVSRGLFATWSNLLHEQRWQDAANLLKSVLRCLLVAASSATAVTFVSGEAVVELFYGSDYQNSGALLGLLFTGTLGIAAVWLQGDVLNAAQKLRTRLVFMIALGMMAAASYAILIPAYGITGAAGALMLTGIVGAVGFSYAVSLTVRGGVPVGTIGRCVVASVVSVLVCSQLSVTASWGSLVIASVLAVSVHLMCLVVLREWKRSDLDLFRGVMGGTFRRRFGDSAGRSFCRAGSALKNVK